MRWPVRACLGALALAAAPWAHGQCFPGPAPTPAQKALLEAVDRATRDEPNPSQARQSLLARIMVSNMCYPLDLTAEQLEALMAETKLRPPTSPATAFAPRYNMDSTAWLGAGTIGDGGTSRPAQLTYSFPDDGAMWGLNNSGNCHLTVPNGANNLGVKLIAGFGSLDRGREMIRSAIASWRRVAGLTYTEVTDNNSPEDVDTTHVSTRGDIRIGGEPYAPVTGALAYNGLPGFGQSNCYGGDMNINTNQFTTAHFLLPDGNFLYFRNTVAHEHGHGLGLMHSVPCNRTKLMEPFVDQFSPLISPDEVRAAIRQYGDRYSPLNNHTAANAKNYGSLTSPLHSVIERDLGLNGPVVVINGNPQTFQVEDDYFKFTLGSTQSVTISVVPTGYSPTGACCNGASCTVVTQVNCAGPTFVQQGSCTPAPCTAPGSPGCNGTAQDPSWCTGQQSTDCSAAGGSQCFPSGFAPVEAQKAGNLALRLIASDGFTVIATSDSSTLGVTEQIAQPTLAAGTYYVRVSDAGGGLPCNQIVQTYDMTIRVGTAKAPPVAIAGLNVKRVRADTTCAFIGSHNSYATESGASIPNNGYAWDLDGDGVFETLGDSQPTTMYVSNGTYAVTLRVNDSNGMTATDTVQVVVFGATTTVDGVGPSSGVQGATAPVTISGTNLKGVASASQVAVSGSGVTVTGTPTVDPMGTLISGLSFVIAPGAPTGARNVTVTNSDGQGSSGGGTGVFTVTTASTTGACCAADGTCSVTTQAACASGFQGLGTVCSPNSCPQPTGACCAANGSCTTTTAAGCAGAFQGPSTSCSPNQCPQPTGACCAVDGSCTISTAGACSGVFQGASTVCNPNPCPPPPGACCNGSTCSVASQAVCTGAHKRFVGSGTTCNAQGNAVSPCCAANFNQDAQVNVSDIFDFLAAWFALDGAADFNGGGITVGDIFAFLSAWFAGC